MTRKISAWHLSSSWLSSSCFLNRRKQTAIPNVNRISPSYSACPLIFPEIFFALPGLRKTFLLFLYLSTDYCTSLEVEFFSSDGIRLGDKNSLDGEIHRITGIAVDALRGRPLSDFSVSERMDWAAKRTTTRKEDEAYSLLGKFDVCMPLIYGERERALVRLREQIDRSLQGTNTASPFQSSTCGSSVFISTE